MKTILMKIFPTKIILTKNILMKIIPAKNLLKKNILMKNILKKNLLRKRILNSLTPTKKILNLQKILAQTSRAVYTDMQSSREEPSSPTHRAPPAPP